MASFEQEADQTSTTSFDNKETDTQENNDQEVFIEYNGRKMSREDILTKLQNADKHIQTLEGERSTDRDRVEKMMERLEALEKERTGMNDLLERLDTPQYKNNADESKDTKSIDEDQLMERAANAAYDRMNREQQEAKKRQNQAQVAEKLKNKYGENVDKEVFSVTRELGYSDEEAFELAGARPKAFLRLIGFEEEPQQTSPKSFQGDVRNPSNAESKENKPVQHYKLRNTKDKISSYENRVAQKLKELGIET